MAHILTAVEGKRDSYIGASMGPPRMKDNYERG
jgi:hypothetical protein